jgi:hypothetical protein
MSDLKSNATHNAEPELHPACWPEERLLDSCKITFSRASGPGGQHRNKVETSVQIEFLPKKVIATASERRTQIENRKMAVQRLRCKLAVEIRTHDTSIASNHPLSLGPPSASWQTYCRDGRIDIAESNTLWPAILAEGLDAIANCDWNLPIAAAGLGTSTSQLVKLLKKYPPAFSMLNEERKLRGHKALE